MKHIRIRNYMVLCGASIVLFLSGCISIPNSPTPRFYMLGTVQENQESNKINNVSSVVIGIGPVRIPEYQNRPQIVTQSKEKRLTFAQFDRWGEPLEFGVARIIDENLANLLPEVKFALYPWNTAIAVKYQVVIEIDQLDSELDKDLFLVAQWFIIDTKSGKTMISKRSEFLQPIVPQDYSGVVKTLSTVCTSLSSEIAEALKTLEKQPKSKEESATLNEKTM